MNENTYNTKETEIKNVKKIISTHKVNIIILYYIVLIILLLIPSNIS